MIEPPTIEHFRSLIYLGLLAGFLLVIAFRYHFFKLPKFEPTLRTFRFVHILLAFALMFIVPLFLTPIAFRLLPLPETMTQIQIISTLQFITNLIYPIAFCLLLTAIGKKTFRILFSREESLFFCILFGCLSYVVAFPLVTFIDGLFEALTYLIFGTFGEEQLAVRFLKEVTQDKMALAFALYTIVLAAPFVEELVFRGFIQTYLRERLGTKSAIYITSAAFSLFHYSSKQGVGNIALLITLFVFALFLGFAYERTRNLLTPMILHLTFNLVTVIRLLSI